MKKNEPMMLLSIIADHDGAVDWYWIGRTHLHDFDSPATFDEAMIALSRDGLVEERLVDARPLPKLYLTEKGRAALIAFKQETNIDNAADHTLPQESGGAP